MRSLILHSRIGDCRLTVDESLDGIRHRLAAAPSVVVTDANVRRLHGSLLPEGRVIEIGTGEGVKTLATVELLYRRFLDLEVDRSTFVWGLGGGIVCDVTGFAASTYLRGLPFGFVPTTLLAQVDAAVGGKNGVNLDGYKNLVGVFRQPRSVILNFDLLRTLPETDLLAGLTETVKAALIAGPALFAFLERNWPALLALDTPSLSEAAAEAIRIKAGIVEADAEESRDRKTLNFGHTLGHALERAAGLAHGQAVACGMTFAVRLSAARGLLPDADRLRIEAILRRLRPAARVSVAPGLVLEALRRDKKRRGSSIDFVLLKGIGQARLAEIPYPDLEAAVHDLCEHR